MRLALKKRHDGTLQGDNEEDIDFLSKLKPNDVIAVKYEDNRDIQTHKRFFAFIKFVYENTETNYSMDEFRQKILLEVGHIELKLAIVNKEVIEVRAPASISFEAVSENKFKSIFNAVKNYILNTYNIEYGDWIANYVEFEGKCQYPDCSNLATDTHELIPGQYRRSYCIQNKLQIRVCRACHNNAHGIYMNYQEGQKFNDYQKEMYMKGCKVLNVDPTETWIKCMNATKKDVYNADKIFVKEEENNG